jgi:hypothetical protein
MITWLQNATGKHHRIIFGFLLVVIVVSFVFYGFAGRGAFSSGAYMYQGVDLNDPAVRSRFRDATFFAQMTGQRMDNNGLVQRVAELSLADALGIPLPLRRRDPSHRPRDDHFARRQKHGWPR